MIKAAALPRMCGAAVMVGIALAGCVQTTGGVPVKGTAGGTSARAAKPLAEPALDQILLSVNDVSAIIGGTGLQVSNSSEDLGDSTDIVDNPDCVGAMFAAERHAYDGTDWKALRDQVIREPGDQKSNWAEQSVVLFGSAAKAGKVFQRARERWKTCASTSLTTSDDSDGGYRWDFGKVGEPSDTVTTIDMVQQDSDGWTCQHAMGLVSNVVVEGIACGHGVTDQGQRIVTAIVQNAQAQ